MNAWWADSSSNTGNSRLQGSTDSIESKYPGFRLSSHNIRWVGRIFAPLEAFGELLHKILFNYKFSLVSKTVFGLSLRRLVLEIFNRVQIFKEKDPVYVMRDRGKNTIL